MRRAPGVFWPGDGLAQERATGGRGRMDGQGHGAEGGEIALAFAARVAAAPDPALGRAVAGVVGHLHAMIAGMRLTPGALHAAIGFLTEVGHATDSRRQEWVLLADVLGVSTLVEDLSSTRPPGATPNTVAGPFYRADVPECPNGADISRDGRGEPVEVRGRIVDCAGRPVGGAMVEVWQANGDGVYENQEPDLQPEFNLRGRLRAAEDGTFGLRTVRPRGYPLPADGPVGQLLARLGCRLERPAHIHFRVTAPGFQRLTTHIFDRDDPAIGNDALFGVRPALLGEFRPQPAGGYLLEVGFVLAPEEAAGG
ncbi:MAG: 6-chlorohydroxyquinol-1,2-dioxygenase [Rhodobacteraceae bacterium]|nr:6-chlorohydroxyquinol-1,2-dioxygenase [Paracoccaceae bacterium]